jgi:tRNA(Ile)-lysidine synthetase-like protein
MVDLTRTAIRRHAFVAKLAAGLRRCGVEQGDRLLLAVSGGADSTALLLGAAALADRPEWQLELHVGHLHHHLRDEADEDAAFVEQLAQVHASSFRISHIYPADKPGNLEAVARRMRYGRLGTMAREVDADAVVTAHHANDQLETLLMRLVRGASVRGMAGIAPVRRVAGARLIRPMLEIDGGLPRRMLEDAGQAWREDATNAQLHRVRARLRANVLPELHAIREDAAIKAGDAARQLRDAADLLGRLTDKVINRVIAFEPAVSATASRQSLRPLRPYILRQTVRAMCLMCSVPSDRLSSRLVEQIADTACDTSNEMRRYDLAGGATASVDATHLRVQAGPN